MTTGPVPPTMAMSAAPIRKLLIANRGEIAVRVARTARSLGIATVAVHSVPDADALHVEVCDEAMALGGHTAADSYLRIDALIAAARATGADAVHPGYGFLAESADFAAAVIAAGLTWVGPSPDSIRAMGDKLEAKQRMAAAGVPLVPGVDVVDPSDAAAIASAAEQVGYPIMVKAAAGGGGKGMRLVATAEELSQAVGAAAREAQAAFGDGRVFLERALVRARHVEIQVLADTHGNAVHLLERECSIQRRHQKIIEECPSPVVDADLRAAMGGAAVKAAQAIAYVGAGTVEFLLADDGSFHFLEMNTRLQVEHPVTEEVVRIVDATGTAHRLDLVAEQLRVAEGARLDFAQADVRAVGHAIEARLYAEDPGNGFLPAAGQLDVFDASAVADIRVDTGVRSGDVISTHYDPMIAKVIAHAATRSEAARRLATRLDTLPLGGSTTNRAFLVAVLRDHSFLAGDTTTAFIAERFPDDEARRLLACDEARFGALGAVAILHLADARAAGPVPGVGLGFSNTLLEPERQVFVVERDDEPVGVAVSRDRDGLLDVTFDGDVVVTTSVVGRGEGPPSGPARHRWLAVRTDGYRTRVDLWSVGNRHHVRTPWGMVSLTAQPRFPDRAEADVAGATRAPMPGTVLAVPVAPGVKVFKGDVLVLLEAMKMEHRITAPFDGVVSDTRVTVGAQVDADDVLVIIDPIDS